MKHDDAPGGNVHFPNYALRRDSASWLTLKSRKEFTLEEMAAIMAGIDLNKLRNDWQDHWDTECPAARCYATEITPILTLLREQVSEIKKPKLDDDDVPF